MNREMEEVQLTNKRKEEEWKLERENILKQLVDKDNQMA